MKKSHVAAIGGMLMIMSATLWADIIPENYHVVRRCTKIQNVNEFPDIAVISCMRYVLGSKIERRIIKMDSCINASYKSTSFYLLWTFKSYLDSVGLDSVPIDDFIKSLAKKKSQDFTAAASPIHLLSANASAGDYLLSDSFSIVQEELFYNLFTINSTIAVYCTKSIIHYSDSTQKTETFGQPTQAVSDVFRGVRKSGIDNFFVKNDLFTFKTEFSGTLAMQVLDSRGKMIAKYTKSCAPHCTYMLNCAGMKSGLYWMRMRSPNADIVRRLTIIR